jgi:hypothetical protein
VTAPTQEAVSLIPCAWETSDVTLVGWESGTIPVLVSVSAIDCEITVTRCSRMIIIREGVHKRTRKRYTAETRAYRGKLLYILHITWQCYILIAVHVLGTIRHRSRTEHITVTHRGNASRKMHKITTSKQYESPHQEASSAVWRTVLAASSGRALQDNRGKSAGIGV